MNSIKFRCTLLSDIILNSNSGTKEKQATLDFIPGNVFLGIVAGKLYNKLSASDSMEIFHSGKVRFGDAHLLCGNTRTLKIPAALYYKKGEKLIGDGAYVMYKWENVGDAQPKQCRNGFYAFSENKRCTKVDTDKNKSVAIKSAYDRDSRSSKDEAMYSYESLNKGLRFGFEIEYDDTVDTGLISQIREALAGKRHIGHSKTAQYGLVDIEAAVFDDVLSGSTAQGDGIATAYADSRLIFIDECGTPTFQPSAQDLGFGTSATIDWSKSQIRTFQYAPWNAKRHSPDTDRYGIEKGSVFVVNLNGTDSPKVSKYVGSYRCEGFGKVIYNPSFLQSDTEGKSILVFQDGNGTNGSGYGHFNNAAPTDGTGSSDGIKCSGNSNCSRTEKYPLENSLNKNLIKKVKSLAEGKTDTYEIVNKFVRENAKEFKTGGERFASQWGYIRKLAGTCKDLRDCRNKLFDEKTGYLSHGVAEEKWRYKKQLLENFINKTEITEKNWREIMINLASEMSKECKK